MNKQRKLIIATSNPGKFREIMEVMHDLPFEVISSADLGLNDQVDESCETYRDNAAKKVRHYAEQARKAFKDADTCEYFVLAEDSGIVVDAIAGELGVKTRRWGAGEKASDEEWIEYFLNRLENIPEAKRTARFICCAAVLKVVDADEFAEIDFFEGVTEGRLTRQLEAPIYKGLPISSCFVPTGFQKVYAVLNINEKNRVSHRGKAMHAVKEYLKGR